MQLPAARFNPDLLLGPLAGVAGGLAAALVFATLHALLIVPIWERVPSAMRFTALCGAGAGLAFAEIHGSSRIATHSARDGARFGALLWLVIAPVTLADAALRAAGVAPRYEWFAVAVAVALAIAGGGLLGARLGGTWRAAIATAGATLLLTFAMAGPVPIGRSGRAFGIWLAVLPACVVAGLVMVATLTIIARVWTAAPRSLSSRSEAGSA